MDELSNVEREFLKRVRSRCADGGGATAFSDAEVKLVERLVKGSLLYYGRDYDHVLPYTLREEDYEEDVRVVDKER